MSYAPVIKRATFYEGRGTNYAFVAPLDDGTYVGVALTERGRESVERATLPKAQAWLDRCCTADMVWECKPSRPTALRDTSSGFVYFIADEEGYIKIGHALEPAKRLSALQTGHRQQLTLLATVPGGPAEGSGVSPPVRRQPDSWRVVRAFSGPQRTHSGDRMTALAKQLIVVALIAAAVVAILLYIQWADRQAAIDSMPVWALAGVGA